MKSTPTNLPIFSAYNRKEKIDPKPQYQRGAVWSESMKQLLIDSIIRGYDIPKFYLRIIDDGEYESEVVDGQQRLRAIWDFRENKYPLGEESKGFSDFPDLDGKYYSELSSDQQDVILSFNLTMTEIRDATENEIRELFLRLQEGKSLTPPEKRNAMLGDMRDYIEELAKHSVFLKTQLVNKRFEYDDWASHITCLEIAGGPANVKAADLKSMYENNCTFNTNSPVAKKIKKVLNYMNKVFPNKTPELDVKWGFVDLYQLISHCMNDYDIKKREGDFYSFYIGFEKERREVGDSSDLISSGSTPWSEDLYYYLEAFRRDGNKRGNLEVRRDIYIRRFIYDYPDLVPRDETRAFTKDERIVIWRRAHMRCQNPDCGKEIELDEMHADHIIPHSSGGLTTLENAQCLCVECNLRKSSN